MISALLLCTMLLQASPQTALKPLIDNERVTVWEVTSSPVMQPADAVIVSLSGEAEFVAKGAKPKIVGDRLIVIDLKDHPPDPIPNTTRYPLAFPRAGSKKVFENERVIVWDFTWTPGVATAMHFHDKDAVIVMLEDGDLQSTTADGHVDLYPYNPGTVRFGARGRIHTETLVRGQQRAIVTELK